MLKHCRSIIIQSIYLSVHTSLWFLYNDFLDEGVAANKEATKPSVYVEVVTSNILQSLPHEPLRNHYPGLTSFMTYLRVCTCHKSNMTCVTNVARTTYLSVALEVPPYFVGFVLLNVLCFLLGHCFSSGPLTIALSVHLLFTASDYFHFGIFR